MTRRIAPAGLISLGFEELTLADSTAVGLNSTNGSAEALHVSVETQAVRYRADGTDPALTTGVLLATGSHWLEAVGEPAKFKFIQSTGSATVSIMAYKNAGGGR